MSSSQKPELRLAYVDYAAAKYAVEHWHYSRSMPDPKMVKIGVWEDQQYIGVVLFSRGVSSTNLSKSLGITSTEICELSRVALRTHQASVTKIISVALLLLKRCNPALRIVVSYADENQGHLGVIYQAGNWLFTGQTAASPFYRDAQGKKIHSRSCSASGVSKQFGAMKRVLRRQCLTKVQQKRKWRYMMPLDKAMRTQLQAMGVVKPYPKRVTSDTIDTAADQAEKGGETPTVTLHSYQAANGH